MSESPGSQIVLASDAEREAVVGRLSDAVVEGRLTLEEFSDRVGRAQVARTHEELATLTEDIPSGASYLPGKPAPVAGRALFSHLQRRGRFELGARPSFRSVFGTIDLDLREATLSSPDTELRISNLFGTVTVIVPDCVDVQLGGGGLLASDRIELAETEPPPGAPRLWIRSSGMGGTLRVLTGTPRVPGETAALPSG